MTQKKSWLNTNYFKSLVLLLFLIVPGLLVFASRSRYDQIKDSIPFSINSSSGWSLFPGTYVNQFSPDSVDIEIVFQHSGNINWNQEQLIGTVTAKGFMPKKDQIFSFLLVTGNVWNVRVSTAGNCYISQVSGSAPVGDPVALPIKAHFKFD